MPDPIQSSAYGRTARRAVFETPAPPLRPRPRRSRFLLVGLPMFAVFAAFGSIVWLAYIDGAPSSAMGEPPLIKAEAGPLKLTPDDPGGRIVADQGEVRELFAEGPEPQRERLLPPPEEPLDPVAGAETAPVEAEVAEAVEPPPPAAATAPEPAPSETATAAQAPRPAEAEPQDGATAAAPAAQVDQAQVEAEQALETLLAEVSGRSDNAADAAPGAAGATDGVSAPRQVRQAGARDQEQEVAAVGPAEPSPRVLRPGAEQRPAAPAATATRRDQAGQNDTLGSAPRTTIPVRQAPSDTQVAAVGPSYRIQLAAVREEADARRAWDLFQLDLGQVLAGLDPLIERAETANGVFYRVQVGPFSDLGAAEALCEDLKQRNASCFVIRR